MSVRYSDRALADLNSIADYIARRRPSGAVSVMSRIAATVTLIGRHPGVGRKVRAREGERRQFQYEMYMGLIQSKLQQCRFDNLTERDIGYPWSFNQMANISTYKPGQYHAELDLLMTDFAKKSWWRR